MGMFYNTIGCTTNLCLPSFLSWFGGVLKSLDRIIPVFISRMLSTQEYHTETALHDTFWIPNFKVSIGVCTCMHTYTCVSYIWRFGPLTTSWCMRMEAKNSYFKRIAQQGNFKKIALSVARRHQKLVCSFLQSDDFFEKSLDKSRGMCGNTVTSSSAVFPLLNVTP